MLLKKQLITLVIMLILLPQAIGQAQDFPDVCQSGENILPNCNFDGGKQNWVPYLETGDAQFEVLQGGGECHAPLCPAGYIVTQDHFIGGIYQQVPVAAGNTYYANIVWLVFDTLVNDASISSVVGGIGRRVGIDPTGGTDSTSPNVVWSEDNWRTDCKICNVEQVVATAQGDTITVFLRIEDTWRLRAREKGFAIPPSKDQFWMDDLGLKQIAGDAVPAAAATDIPAPPTDTPPPPPTDTPVSNSPVATPAPAVPTVPATAEAAPTDTPEVVPTATPALPTDTPPPLPPTLTPTNTVVPTDTPTPRPTRTPTPLPENRPAPVSAASSSSGLLLGSLGATVCLGGIGLVMTALLLAGLMWLYRLGWGSPEK